jgi:hypothetical protein
MKLIETKSILAKLMATENITVEQRNTSTAYFDTKNRILTVPMLDKQIPAHTYDLFMGHEVGHALYTPDVDWDDALKKVPKSIVNVIEDSRIERKIRYKYPGLKNSFVRGYNDLMERDFFGISKTDVNELNLIDRINLHEKCGASLGIDFNEEEMVFLKEAQNTQTFEDVVELSTRIYEYMKKQKQKVQSNPAPVEIEITEMDMDSVPYDMEPSDSEDVVESVSGEENEENQNESNDGSSEESSSDGQDESEESYDTTGQEADESTETESTGDEGDTESNGVSEEDGGVSEQDAEEKGGDTANLGSGGEENYDDIKSFTDENYRENESKLFSEEAEAYEYANIPDLNLDNIIMDYKDLYEQYTSYWKTGSGLEPELFQEFKRESSKVVSYLVKEFELRKNAQQMKKASTAKTGDLDMKKIFSYKYQEDLFKKLTVMPGAKSHGLVMFIDWSGSMVHHMDNTIKQLLNLVLFCKKVNIPYEVYAFIQSNSKSIAEAKVGNLFMNNFRLMNLLSSRMNSSEFSKAGAALMSIGKACETGNFLPSFMVMGSTPLNESVVAAMKIIPEFQKKNRLQVVNTVFLTDGEADPTHSIYQENGHYVYPRDINPFEYKNGLRIKKSIIVRDPITKHQEKTSTNSSRGMTKALVKLLKYRTNCNVVGFYILSVKDLKWSGRSLFRDFYDRMSEIRSKLNKEKCMIAEKGAFDEYYLLKSDKKDYDDGEFVVRSTTTKGIVNAFNKYHNNKLSNRVILNRFIGMIS